MRWLLTVGLLLIVLSAGVASSGAQTRGPGPGEVPSELWKQYPLEEPRPTPRHESRKREAREARALPAVDRAMGDDGQNMLLFVVSGLALLGLAAGFLGAARRRASQPLRRRKEGASAGEAPAAQQAANGQRAEEGRATAAGRLRRPPAGEAQPGRGGAIVARAPRSPAPPRPTAPAMQSHIAPGGDAPALATLRRPAALGYVSAPAEVDTDGVVRRQQREIEAVCGRKGLALLKLVRDVEAGGGSDLSRPGLASALERLAAHDASCLVVASLDRLTRSAVNLGTLVEWLDRCGARLVVVDIDLDTGTPKGRLHAKALAAVDGSERTTLSQRPRKGRDAERTTQRFSRQPRVSDRPELKRRIADMRASGMTLQAIADTLNAEGVPTMRGGTQWRPSSVQAAAGYKRPPSRKGRFG
jgi:DNA invertase Pin-like site-specific DNA recombinase